MSKRNKLMIIWVTVLGVLVIGATFASWLVSRKQTNFNSLNTGCVSLSFSNGSGTLTLQNAAPMPDEDGLSLTGYTFTLRNNCKTEVSYLLNLDLFNVANQTNLTTGDIKLAIDNKVPRKIAYYEDASKNDQSAYGAKTLTSGKLAAKSSETHTVKMWVNENTTTQNAVFSYCLFVMASPNLTVPEVASEDCFVMNNDEPTHIDYYLSALDSCPDNVIVPNQINGNDVEQLNKGTFLDANVLTWYHDDTDMVDVIILDEEHYTSIANTLTYLFDNSINDNGTIGNSNTSNYTLYRFSQYPNWDDYLEEHAYVLAASDVIDNGYYSAFKILNVPLNYDLPSLYTLFESKDISAILAYPRSNRSLYATNPAVVGHYVESIDLSNCTSLEYIEQIVAYNDLNLTKVEFPNNQTFPNSDTFDFEDYAFGYNNLTQVFLPIKTGNVGTAFYDNEITHLELYSTETMLLKANSFRNNQIASLEVNSTIGFSGNITTSNKPFRDNPLTAANITIGYNSTNTKDQFINVE